MWKFSEKASSDLDGMPTSGDIPANERFNYFRTAATDRERK